MTPSLTPHDSTSVAKGGTAPAARRIEPTARSVATLLTMMVTMALFASACRTVTTGGDDRGLSDEPTAGAPSDEAVDGGTRTAAVGNMPRGHEGGSPRDLEGDLAAPSDLRLRPHERSDFEVLSTWPAEAGTIVEAVSLHLLTPSSTRWRVIAGRAQGTEFLRVITPAANAGADPATSATGAVDSDASANTSPDSSPHSSSVELRIGDEQTLLLRRSAEGGIEMPATTAHADRAVSLFDPPLGIAPARVTAGTAFSTRSAMRVVEERDRSREMQKGQATRTATILDRCRVRTPMGEFDVVRVEIRFRAQLSLASAEERAVQYIDPALGMIAEERREVVRAVGIFGRTVEQTVVRVE